MIRAKLRWVEDKNPMNTCIYKTTALDRKNSWVSESLILSRITSRRTSIQRVPPLFSFARDSERRKSDSAQSLSCPFMPSPSDFLFSGATTLPQLLAHWKLSTRREWSGFKLVPWHSPCLPPCRLIFPLRGLRVSHTKGKAARSLFQPRFVSLLQSSFLSPPPPLLSFSSWVSTENPFD